MRSSYLIDFPDFKRIHICYLYSLNHLNACAISIFERIRHISKQCVIVTSVFSHPRCCPKCLKKKLLSMDRAQCFLSWFLGFKISCKMTGPSFHQISKSHVKLTWYKFHLSRFFLRIVYIDYM